MALKKCFKKGVKRGSTCTDLIQGSSFLNLLYNELCVQYPFYCCVSVYVRVCASVCFLSTRFTLFDDGPDPNTATIHPCPPFSSETHTEIQRGCAHTHSLFHSNEHFIPVKRATSLVPHPRFQHSNTPSLCGR